MTNFETFCRTKKLISNLFFLKSDFEHCIKNTKLNVAIVNFQIASSANDLINKIMKTPRVTYADILSNIGTYLSI